MKVKNLIILISVCYLLFLNVVQCIVEGTFRERSQKYCRLKKQCKIREEKDYNYRDLMKISDFPSITPDGYLVKLPFFALAPRDAHIVFSPVEKPNWNRDNVYEILIGGWANNRTLIRRRRQDLDLTTEYTFNVLRKDDPLKIEIQIRTGGEIKVYIEYQKEPLAVAKDPNPLPIKYFGFASYDNSLNKYFYDCPGENTYDVIELEKRCSYDEAFENEYKKFHAISDIAGIRPDGYLIKFPLFIKAERDAHILLTPKNRDDRSDEAYEILIGGWANTRIIIRRKQGADVLRDIQVADTLTADRYVTFLVQITTGGDIKIFSRQNLSPYKLIAGATDPTPLPIEYISFGSYNTARVQAYFNCSLMVAPPDIVPSKQEHPLLVNTVPSSIDLRNFLITKCNFYEASDYVYKRFISLKDISGAEQTDYLVRIVFYVQGSRDANIIFTASDRPNFEEDSVYEFVIGGWGNTRILIRRKYSGNVLTETFENNIVSDKMPTKFLIEIAKSGSIRLYSEKYKTEPIAKAFDANIVPVKYVSFSSFESNRNEFFYNCQHIHTII